MKVISDEGCPGYSQLGHPECSRAMDSCCLDNVAVAALEALATGTHRIAPYDFDVHHANTRAASTAT
jgi:acetoin utilization deacetylase AcuC-like enzyme